LPGPSLIGAAYLAAGSRALATGGQNRAQVVRAVVALDRARAWSPGDPAIYRALAQAYGRLGQAQDAVTALEQAYRLQPGSLLIQQELAQAYEATAQAKRADGIWRSLGLSAPALLALGEQARLAKHYSEALTWYERAGRASPRLIEPLYYAGRAYRDWQRLDESLRVLQKASALAPDNRDVWYEIGQTYAARQEARAALEAFRHGLDAHEGQAGRSNLLFRIGYAQQYTFAPSDLAAAGAAYAQALALDDYPIDAWQKAETYHQSGVLLALQKRWQEAIREYEQALAINPRHYQAQLSLAQALWQVGQRDAAFAQARQAEALDPTQKHAYRILGDFYAAEQKVAEASAMYTRVLEIDPHDVRARQGLEALR
jgi:tetratricopeptide (TPR) repeat protein